MPKNMGAKNANAILDWCDKHRPDLVDHITKIMELPNEQGAAYMLLMTSAFEAGRMFQTTVDAPTSYEPFDVDYLVLAERV